MDTLTKINSFWSSKILFQHLLSLHFWQTKGPKRIFGTFFDIQKIYQKFSMKHSHQTIQQPSSIFRSKTNNTIIDNFNKF